MKKLIYFILTVPFIIMSCSREPYADFYTSRTKCEVGDIIYFTNNSLDADHFKWDFGDGTISFDISPSHIYQSDGVYTVCLTAFAGNRFFNKAYLTINVLMPTSLEITVLEYYDEYSVSDASVILYNSLDDWWDEYNPLIEGFTNQHGIVTFSNLYAQRYYVDVWEEYHNNWILAEEDYGFIETDILIPHEMNYFIAWVDYVPPAKKSDSRPEKNIRILKLEKVNKRTYDEKIDISRQKIEERKSIIDD